MASGGPSRPVFNRVCCPCHPEANLVEDHQAGDLICPECGLVVGDRVIDVGSEWRTFSNDSGSVDRSRVGAAEDPSMDGGGLTTFIGPSATPYGMKDTSTFSKWQKTGSSGDRGLMGAFNEISVMANRIHLPKSIVDRARELFRQMHEEKTLKGRANDAIAASCLYIACRQEGVPRSFKEICAVSRHSKKDIGRCFKLIHKAMNAPVAVVDPEDFMSRFCTQLELPQMVQKAAIHISQKVQELDLAPGRMYLSVTAAAIYMASQASDKKKTQKEVGEVVGVADSTIRQTYRLIFKDRDKLFPSDFQFTTPLDELPNH